MFSSRSVTTMPERGLWNCLFTEGGNDILGTCGKLGSRGRKID
jgi:hypothetical protein